MIFLKPPKKIEIQDFEPQKWSEPTYICENIRVSPPHTHILGASGCEKRTLQNKIKKVTPITIKV